MEPYNSICKHYYLTNEVKMAKSLFTREKVGKVVECDNFQSEAIDQINTGIPKKLKRFFSSELARLCRDIVWGYGRYNESLLEDFIKRCGPDVIFSLRMGSVKMCRLESIVLKYTDAPLVVYTGDDDYSLLQYNFNPIFWLRRFWVRKWISRMAPFYRFLYCQSERQMEEYSKDLGVESKFLVKAGDFELGRVHSTVENPIQVTYGGKLYCNRWKTLVLLVEAISKVNEYYQDIKIQLNIYTSDLITSRQNTLLNDGHNSIIRGTVSGDELKRIYEHSDLVIHVEGLDKKNRLLTKDSFSTKVMDCLASGSAVMAIAWEKHAALQYLKKMDAALIASNQNEIEEVISNIVSNPQLLLQYASNAYKCGKNFHNRKEVQKTLMNDFKLISERC